MLKRVALGFWIIQHILSIQKNAHLEHLYMNVKQKNIFIPKKRYKQCKYIGTIEKINKHFLKCAFTEFKCPFCYKNIIQANIRKHYESECVILITSYKEKFYIGQHNDKYLPDGFGIVFLEENNGSTLST